MCPMVLFKRRIYWRVRWFYSKDAYTDVSDGFIQKTHILMCPMFFIQKTHILMCPMVSLPVFCWLWISSCLAVNPLHLCYKHKRVNVAYGNNRYIVGVTRNTGAHYVGQLDSCIWFDTCHCAVWDGTVPRAASLGLPRFEYKSSRSPDPQQLECVSSISKNNYWYPLTTGFFIEFRY